MIPLFKVRVPENIGNALQEVFDTGMITEGSVSDELEARLCDRFLAPTSLVNSCTSALTLAYRMSGVGPDTEVITTPMTCMATNEPIHTLGAKIVWSDIDPMTGNIDHLSIAEKITPKTRAIVGVHWAGEPFDVDGVKDVIRKSGQDIKLVVDAAHAFGSTYNGKHVGSEADFVCFSFQAIKHFTTGDGGAICSRDPKHDDTIKRLRWFGLDRKFVGDKWSQDITMSGYKFHMNNINAKIGLEQLKTIDSVIGAHRMNGCIYDMQISNPKITLLNRSKSASSSHWIYTLRLKDTDQRDLFKKHMAATSIATDVVHHRNDRYSVFKDFRDDQSLRGVDEFCSTMINIPVGWWLTPDDRQHITDAVNSF